MARLMDRQATPSSTRPLSGTEKSDIDAVAGRVLLGIFHGAPTFDAHQLVIVSATPKR